MFIRNLGLQCLLAASLTTFTSASLAEPLPTRDQAAQALAASYNQQQRQFMLESVNATASAQGDLVHYHLTLAEQGSSAKDIELLAQQVRADICKVDQQSLYRGVRVKLVINASNGDSLYQAIQSDNDCSRLPY
ncbi:hypothetical protein [Agarivorans litoreus]|uniref:hypothetical protein n=1 Tax=Agarivorans litoreus TaxID=1510455 RepID=UPI001C7DE24B|nr:hypothetical protein [Agarivorans litoreus]